MKAFIFSIATVLISLSAHAGALASLWNGEQFRLSGQILVQDADKPLDFYFLPTRYKVKATSVYNESTGESERKTWVTHQVVTDGTLKYSVYNIRMKLDEPGRFETLRAESELRQKVGLEARIKGLVPICGLSLGSSLVAAGEIGAQPNPSATVITYSIHSSEAEQCKSIVDVPEFNLQIRVPLSREPEFARAMTSDVGLVLPSIDVILPYKYNNKVTMLFNSKTTYEMMSQNVGLKGTYKMVTGEVESNIRKMFQSLEITSQMKVDWQGTDVALRDRFITQAIEFLSQAYIKYNAVTGPVGDKEVVVGDKDKSVSSSLFSVSLAMSEQAATQKADITIDFSSATYSTVKSQTQLDVSRVSKSVLSPEVQQMLEVMP